MIGVVALALVLELVLAWWRQGGPPASSTSSRNV